MSRIISSMVLAEIPAPQRTAAYKGIIEAFRDEDCDTLDECYGQDPAFDAALDALQEIQSAPPEPDSTQLEKTFFCEHKDWEYLSPIDATPAITARDFLSDGVGPLQWPQIHVAGIDSISIVDCETGEEMLKPPSEADIASWSKPATPYVVELRSDDNEHLTMEWLDSVRPALGENSYAWQIATAKVFFDVRFCNQTIAYFVCICDETFRWQRMFDITTRGEVRQICRALKAEVPK